MSAVGSTVRAQNSLSGVAFLSAVLVQGDYNAEREW